MSWKLFIDDERFPPSGSGVMVVARNSFDAIEFMEMWGLPTHISFDHDLGGLDTAMVVISWLEEKLMEGSGVLPTDFTYSVHSMNPVGAKNINVAMQSLLWHIQSSSVN